MKHNFKNLFLASFAASILTSGALASSYQIGQDGPAAPAITQPVDGSATTTDESQGPVRLARFSDVEGNVTWRSSADADWSPASVNLPLRQGAQIWVTDGGRAEIQFDDGSELRLGNGAVVTLQTLYSDSDGEFTEVQMNEGLATMHLLHSDSIYQVDTPFVSVKAVGPSQVRIGVDSAVEVADQSGDAVLEGGQGKTDLQAGNYVYITDQDAPYQIQDLPDSDLWDQWNDQRNAVLTDSAADNHLPPDLSLVAGDLDSNGTWHNDPQYGWVWSPTVTDPSWRPYEHGRWVWVDPFGWTWVASEDWGWAPFHYGTWIDASYGWAWVPGPAQQYWCPAVVSFSTNDGNIGWCALAPDEVHYPGAIDIGFTSGNWAFNFSIGACAVYYPENDRYCLPHPWTNGFVNHGHYVDENRSNGIGNHDTLFHFVPHNSRGANGVIVTSASSFGGHGDYHAQADGASFFASGHESQAPEQGRPFAGPRDIHPTDISYSATRTVTPNTHPAQNVLNRGIVRGALPDHVAHFAPPIAHSAVPDNGNFGRSRSNAGNTFAPDHSFTDTRVQQRTFASPRTPDFGIGNRNTPQQGNAVAGRSRSYQYGQRDDTRSSNGNRRTDASSNTGGGGQGDQGGQGNRGDRR